MSTMKSHSCSFLSRLVLCGLAAPLILFSSALVRADAIRTFDVSGTAQNVSGGTLGSCAAGATCAFSGMFQVDTTAGTVESSGFHITFPGLPAFDTLDFATPAEGIGASASTSALNALILAFTTAPTPGSLVGFTGGSIVDGSVFTLIIPFQAVFENASGTITPVSSITAPEPSSLVLFASSMLVLGLTRRFGKKVGRPLSA